MKDNKRKNWHYTAFAILVVLVTQAIAACIFMVLDAFVLPK